MPRLNTVLFSFLIILLSNASVALAHGWKTPEAAVNAYITGVKTGSGEHIEMAFTESAAIQYYDDKGTYHTFTRNSFKKAVDTGNQWEAEIKITDMKITGKAANATVDFTWGENKEHGYTDYLNLIYDKDSWHITDKVAQYVKRQR